MWINKSVYQELRESLAAAVAVRDSQFATLRATEATMNWLTVRVSQLEHERSILLQNYLGVTVPVLKIHSDESARAVNITPEDQTSHFRDVGDDEAKRMGIDWDPTTGAVTYHEQAE